MTNHFVYIAETVFLARLLPRSRRVKPHTENVCVDSGNKPAYWRAHHLDDEHRVIKKERENLVIAEPDCFNFEYATLGEHPKYDMAWDVAWAAV